MRPTLLIGSRGLLGAAVLRSIVDDGGIVATASVPWSTTDASGAVREALLAAHERWGSEWDLLWCAGAAVTGAPAEAFAREVETFESCVDMMCADDGLRPAQFFLASSAGGVYAGGAEPPYTERSEPVPLSPYGHAKLRLEAIARRLGEHRVRVLVGRISNLYGPGQDLSKQQGLISTLCHTYLTREPARIYVSLDTLRDYLFVDDCARLIRDAMERLAEEPPGTLVIKILASQQSASIAAVLGSCRQVFGPRIPVTLGASPLTRQQARDLRLRSVVWTELDQRVLTTLPEGINRTLTDIRRLVVAPRC